MSEKKVLIITYYWPPSGGSGVQRWLKFVKYLPQFGWTPYVFTPENPSFDSKDESLLKDVSSDVEVIKLPIWEPYDVFRRLSLMFSGKGVNSTDFISTGKKSWFGKIATFVRGNFFIPDPKVFWITPSVRFLKDFLSEQKIGTIITTGPPHSMHLIGLRLKKMNPSLKWIADFRDPWSEWDIYDHLSLTKLARMRHKRLERTVLRNATGVITISLFHVKRLELLGGRKVELITNGFDEDDFKSMIHQRTEKFTIRHIGVVDELRDPRPFLECVMELVQQNEDFSKDVLIEFIGNINSALIEYVKNQPGLKDLVLFKRPINHQQLISIYGETDVLLLVLTNTSIAPGNLPGKLFEYIASGKPILCIGPEDGDAAKIIDQSKLGSVINADKHDALQREIETLYLRWKKFQLKPNTIPDAYTRRNLTHKLRMVLEGNTLME